ncbi:MAG TPA: CDP-alcohol phosphatidyltransferase family protein [Thermoleophilaceae bacterium]|nr:CDP-alcohol phosphatidyltransferase family protein [Thermoleophilaceae bacterium]
MSAESRTRGALRAALAYLTKRERHKSPERVKELRWSSANHWTVARGVTVIALLALAVEIRSHELFLAAMAFGWVVDAADGALARRRQCETVFGAQLDALADRLTVLAVAAGSVVLADGATVTVVAAAVVSLQYVAVDQLVFGQFLRFDLWTPDEFHIKSPRVWAFNWSRIGKVVGGLPAGLLALGRPVAAAAIVLAVALIAVRAWCYAAIAKLAEAEARQRKAVAKLLVERLGVSAALAETAAKVVVGDPELEDLAQRLSAVEDKVDPDPALDGALDRLAAVPVGIAQPRNA